MSHAGVKEYFQIDMKMNLRLVHMNLRLVHMNALCFSSIFIGILQPI